MKLFIDDVRNAPDNSWDVVRNYKDAIAYLVKNEGKIKVISFDHDLGENRKTGYDIVCWMERKIYNETYIVPSILMVHSQNPVGVAKMNLVLRRF